MVNASGSINLKTTHNGYTLPGQGGQGDGSQITVPSGHRVWVLVMACAAEIESDLRAVNPPTYWKKDKTFKFRLLAGSSAAMPDYPDKPTVPTEESSCLTYCDVLLKNESGVTTVEFIDNSRRTRWNGGKLNPIYLGFPALRSQVRLKALPWSAGDPIDYDDFLDPDNGVAPDVFGDVVWSHKGIYLLQKAAVANEGLILTFPVINSSAVTVSKTLTVKSKKVDSGNDDFIEISYNLLGAPYNSETGAWQNTDSDSVKLTNPTTLTHAFTLDFVPGRNLLRVYFRNITDTNLTAHIANKFLDDEALYPDREMIEGILHNNNFTILNSVPSLP